MPLFECYPQLQPRQVRARAAVRPGAEGQVRVGEPVQPELVRTGILPPVAPSRCCRQHDAVARPHRTPRELGVSGHDAHGAGDGEVAQALLDCVGDPVRFVAQQLAQADESGLPADPAFRSAFSSCVDWASRTALAQSQARGSGQLGPAPLWGWGPGGPPTPGTAADADQTDAAEQPLPQPDEPVSFAAHIKPLFRDRDRQSMSFAFGLWSGDEVRSRAPDILRRLHEGSMPCDGSWPAAKIDVFTRWIDAGMQP